MLIETLSGIINTDHIVSVSPPSNEGWADRASIVTFADGSERTVRAPMSTFERACGVIVPAHPGFVVFEALMPDRGDEDQGIFYRQSPAIAFRLGGEAVEPMPITADGEPNTRIALWAIQQPGGQCTGPDGFWETIDAFKKHCERAHAENMKGGTAA